MDLDLTGTAGDDGGNHGEDDGTPDLNAGVEQPRSQALLMVFDSSGGLHVEGRKRQAEPDPEQDHGGKELDVWHARPHPEGT